MQELVNYISKSFNVSANGLDEVLQDFRLVVLQKGDYFTRSGAACNKLGFVKSGLARVFLEVDDKEVTQWISTSGYFITDLSSFVFQTPSRWNIQAFTKCEALVIDRNAYYAMLTKFPIWGEIDRLLIAKCFTMMEERIFSHLYMTAEERYNHLFGLHPELFNMVPLQYLASMLGMTPETLSRLRKKQL